MTKVTSVRYVHDQDLVVMDLVDLEHCGFNHSNFELELTTAGIDDPTACWPVALMVNFRGGHVVAPETTQETKTARSTARKSFEMLLAKLLGGARSKVSLDG